MSSRFRLRAPIDILVASLVAVAVTHLGALRRLHQEPVFASSYVDALLDGGEQLRTHGAIIEGDWTWIPEGAALRPGSEGSITIPIEKTAAQQVSLAILLCSRGPVPGSPLIAPNEVDVSADAGASWQRVATDLNYPVRQIDLEPFGRNATHLLLRVHSRYPSGTIDPLLVLHQLEIDVVEPIGNLPDLPLLVILALLPVAVSVLAVSAGMTTTARWAASASTGAFVLALDALRPNVLGAAWHLQRFWLDGALAAMGAIIAVALLVSWRSGRLSALARTFELLALLWVVAWGLLMRWQPLYEARLTHLQPDAEMVLVIAGAMRHPYDSSFREPLWVMLVKLFGWLLGPGRMAARAMSLTLSLSLIPGAWKLTRDYLGSPVAGIVAAVALAASGFFIPSAIEGLRTELYTAVLLAFTYFAFVPAIAPRWRTFGMGVAAGLCSLTVVSSLAPLALVIAYAAWRHKLGAFAAVVAIATMAAFVAPHLAYEKLRYGDPFYYTNLGPVYYRNWEFLVAKRTGCDGCPTIREFYENQIAGSRVSIAQYVFGMHRLWDVVTRTAYGACELLVIPRDFFLDNFLGTAVLPVQLLYLVGLAMLLASPKREILLIPILTLNVIFFLIPLGIEPRLTVHPAPVGAVVLALPVQAAYLRLKSRLASTRPPPAPAAPR